jgi:hypothetical protein
MTRRDIPTSWWEAQTLLGHRDSQKIANNTWLQSREGDNAFELILHHTVVVVYRPNDRYTLFSGGWETRTTKDKINRAIYCTPWNVVQIDFQWYIVNSHTHAYETKTQWKVPFKSGIVVTEEGIEQ